jgi:hypothetical protein
MRKIIFAPLLLLCSCYSHLVFPIKGGTIIKRPNSIPQLGSTIYIEPKNFLGVRSVEDCEILRVFKGADSSIIVVAKGEFSVGYGNLKECYVAKGQRVKRGQMIGILFDKKDSIPDNNLSLSLQKDGVEFQPNW